MALSCPHGSSQSSLLRTWEIYIFSSTEFHRCTQVINIDVCKEVELACHSRALVWKMKFQKFPFESLSTQNLITMYMKSNLFPNFCAAFAKHVSGINLYLNFSANRHRTDLPWKLNKFKRLLEME